MHRIGLYGAHLAWFASGDDAWADRVERAAMLHDVGKLAVPCSIHHHDEFEEIRASVGAG